MERECSSHLLCPNDMGGWINDLDFTSFSTMFQLYEADGSGIIKSCMQWNPFYGREEFRLQLVPNTGLLDRQTSG